MKRIIIMGIIAVAFFAVSTASAAVVFSDGFDYATNDHMIVEGGWTAWSGSGGVNIGESKFWGPGTDKNPNNGWLEYHDTHLLVAGDAITMDANVNRTGGYGYTMSIDLWDGSNPASRTTVAGGSEQLPTTTALTTVSYTATSSDAGKQIIFKYAHTKNWGETLDVTCGLEASPNRVLFTSDFDGHTGVPTTGYVKDVSGSTTAGVTWTKDASVTAIGDLTAITSGGGFVNQGALYSSGDVLKVNNNLSSGSAAGYSLSFTTTTPWDLTTLTVLSRHSNDSATIDQGGTSDLTYSLSGGSLGAPLTASSSETYAYDGAPAATSFSSVAFDLTGTTLETGTYTLAVSMDNLSGIGGAYAIYDGVTLEATAPGAPSIESFTANDHYVTNGTPVTLSWETTDAAFISIDPGVGEVTAQSTAGDGSTNITASASATYTLTASNAIGVATASFELGVGPERPNILLFLVDDMGANDTSEPFQVDALGNDVVSTPNTIHRTPNMETLAAQGMKFTRAYAMPVCTPTRNCLMTGQNSVRHHVTTWTGTSYNEETGQNSTPSHNSPLDWRRTGLDTSVPALPTLLSAGGYRSIHVGKGHFGNAPGINIDPLDVGFDINIGGQETGRPGSYYGTSNFGSGTYQVPHMEAYHGQNIFLTEALTLEMNQAIEDAVNDGVPFFAYMSHYAVHDPYDTDARFSGNYPTLSGNERAFATLLEGMDKSLGDIRTQLDALGVAEDTLVIFMSDNGSTLPLSSDPLRGYKGQKYEGGTRVPMIAAWSKTNAVNAFQSQLIIPADTVETDIVSSFDIFPTLLAVADITHTNLIDGYDLRDYFKGVPGIHRPQELVIHFPHDHNGAAGDYYTVYHEGDYKLIYNYHLDSYELYNVIADVGETTNLAAGDPDRVMAMSRKMAQQLDAHGAQWPTFDANPDYDDPFAMPALPAVDLDNDGIPDNTEDPNDNGLVDTGETDPDNDNSDGDATPDGAEIRTGTDPLNPASDFIGEWVPDGSGGFIATWPSAPGAVYEIQTTDSLTNWIDAPIATGIPAADPGTNTSHAIPASGDPQRFYRIGLLPE